MFLLQERLPHGRDVASVLAASVFAVFSWSLRGFFEFLPSFLESHRIGAILSIFSYTMAFALLESMLITGMLVFVSILLPRKMYRDGFAYKGLLTVLVLTVAMILLQKSKLAASGPGMGVSLSGIGVVFLILTVLILLAQFIKPLQRLFLDIADRLQIFLYVYIPLGALGVLIVIIRNLS